jgi:hypothetical protein
MAQVQVIGRAIESPESRGGAHVVELSAHELRRKRRLDLCEASELSDVPIHELKAAIRAGRLKAERRGRYIIERAELEKFVRGI